ncbi:MAG: phosphatase PAP2 family protein [Spirochaetaceae bacterium]|nr:phosphatase PAP2 family protein [Spirochaetaceae bacterium]
MRVYKSAFDQKIILIALFISLFFNVLPAQEQNGALSDDASLSSMSAPVASAAGFSLNRLTFNGSGEFFKLDPLTDSIIAGTGVTLLGTELVLDKAVHFKNNVWNGAPFDKDDIPALDRFFMQPFSKGFNTAGDIFQYVGLLTPAVLMAAPMEEWLTIGVMYAETVLAAYGIKELAKALVFRPRPYMYYDTKPMNLVEKGDWNESFPSGHSTLAFAGATFASYVFSKYFSDSPWKYVVTAASYSIATATAILRVAGGKHFVTDVLAGAVIGSATGFLVPWLHSLKAGNGSGSVTDHGPSSNVEPLVYLGGVGLKISF